MSAVDRLFVGKVIKVYPLEERSFIGGKITKTLD